MVRPPLNGQAATHGNGSTIGFGVDSPEQIDAWHAAGCQNGGTSCEDPPGVRQGSFGKLYLAYLRDPDGNKLCALHQMQTELTWEIASESVDRVLPSTASADLPRDQNAADFVIDQKASEIARAFGPVIAAQAGCSIG